jgi:uncharacterized protein
MFAAFPRVMKRAVTNVLEAPEPLLRLVGVVSAAAGVGIVWLVRG